MIVVVDVAATTNSTCLAAVSDVASVVCQALRGFQGTHAKTFQSLSTLLDEVLQVEDVVQSVVEQRDKDQFLIAALECLNSRVACMVQCLTSYGDLLLKHAAAIQQWRDEWQPMVGDVLLGHPRTQAAHRCQLDQLPQMTTKLLIETMAREMADARLQEIGCQILQHRAQNAASKMELFSLGGLKVVLKAMDRHLLDTSLQEVASASLASITSQSPEIQGKAKSLGGAKLVLKVMSTQVSSAKVQENCCRTICNLAAEVTDDRDNGTEAVKSVLCAMERHPVGAVQEAGCRALCTLATHSEHRILIGQHGGIEAVLRTMEDHQDDTKVIAAGCSVLCHLAALPSNGCKIAALGGILIVLRAMERVETPLLQEAGCGALCNLAAGNHDNKTEIISFRGIQVVLRAMEHHVEVAAVQEVGCSVLCNLAAGGGDTGKQLPSSLDSVAALLRAMERHLSVKNVQEPGCLALGYLACDEVHRTAIVSLGGVETVTRAQEMHATENVREAARTALRKLQSKEPLGED